MDHHIWATAVQDYCCKQATTLTTVSKCLGVFAVQKVTDSFSALLVQFLVVASLCCIRRVRCWLLLATRRATICKTRFAGS